MAVDVAFPELFDLVGIAAGALEGALYGAMRPGVSVVGVAAFAFVAGFGGSMVRDALLGQGPAAVLSNSMLSAWLVAVALSGLVLRLRWRLGQMLVVVDGLYLPIWVVLGADKAIHHGLGVLPTLLLGIITGLGGGLLRDVLARELPQILRSGAGYGLTAVGSAAMFVALHQHAATSREVDAIITVAAAFAFRMLCLRHGWLTGATERTPSAPHRPGVERIPGFLTRSFRVWREHGVSRALGAANQGSSAIPSQPCKAQRPAREEILPQKGAPGIEWR